VLFSKINSLLEAMLSAKVLQMEPATSVTLKFHRIVETVEANANLHIRSIANKDGTGPVCVVDLPTQSPMMATAGHCLRPRTSISSSLH
jgi:hypothetical protein